MRILVLNYEFPPLGGGASPVSYEIARGYAHQGHSVDVVTMGFRGLPAFEEADGIRIWRVRCWRSKKEVCQPWEQATYLLSAYPLCRRLALRERYDICHTHFVIPTGALAWALHKEFRLPYIITSHGSDIPGFNEDRFTLLHRFTQPFLRRIIRDAALVTTPSRYLKNLIEEGVLGQPVEKIIAVPNGSRSLKSPNTPKENIIVTVGRLLQRKGFHYLIDAFKQLKRDDWQLVVIGEGPYRAELERLAEHRPNIVFTGWLKNPSPEFVSWLNRAKIFGLLSKSESQGIVYLEAMSAGCAILASDSTACRETVTPEIGRLVAPDQIDQVTQALQSMISQPDELAEYGRRAEQRFLRHYQWEQIISTYVHLLETNRKI